MLLQGVPVVVIAAWIGPDDAALRAFPGRGAEGGWRDFGQSCVAVVSVSRVVEQFEQRWRWWEVEPMTGIEPAYSAWEADVLPLNYIGNVAWEG
jgi:hypothetical protein